LERELTSVESRGIKARTLLVPSAIVVAYLILMLTIVRDDLIIRVYFKRQDLPVGVILIVLFLAVARWRPKWRLPGNMPASRGVLAVGGLLALLLWGGTYLVMQNYPLTRDEHMVVFDQGTFAAFELYRLLPAQWSGFGPALVPNFMLDAPGDAMLASAYMPGNAMMRAAFGSILDPALMNPVLAAVGFVLLYRIARRLFADAPGAVWVALAAYALSAQMLVNAMTTYAMTAHVVLNLLWLVLFLRGGRWAHLGAMLVGAWAIGLHQIVFHPLFAGPFILTLLPQRRFGLFATYAAAYAAVLLFWISYPGLLLGMAGIPAEVGSGAGGAGFIATRVLPLITRIDPYLMALTHYTCCASSRGRRRSCCPCWPWHGGQCARTRASPCRCSPGSP